MADNGRPPHLSTAPRRAIKLNMANRVAATGLGLWGMGIGAVAVFVALLP